MKYLVYLPPLAASVLCAAVVWAKLPAPSEEAKAKADEAKAKAAHADKVGAYKLCKSMEKVAADYYADAKKNNKPTKPAVQTPPCTDPGAYVAAAPSKPPIEASGAHSPPKPATDAPSSKAHAADQKKQ
jgi:hypothetical protein